jgi:predicted MFS family arabinose efflux permease
MEAAAPSEADLIKRENILVYVLGAIQFVHILDFVILMPLGPMLMRTFNVTPSQFGLLVSSYTFAAGISNFLTSIVSDRFERKRMLQVCFAGFLVGTLLCAFAPNFYLLLGARIFAGAFGGVLNAVVFALIADLIPPQRRGAATGVVMSAFSISSVVGVPIGLALAEWFDWHAPFLFIVAVGAIFWLLANYCIPKVNNRAEPRSPKETLKQFVKIAVEPKHIQGFFMTSSLAFGIFMIIPFLSPSMVRNVGLAESDLKYIYLCGGAATVFSARWIGRLCDRLGCFKVFTAVAGISFIPVVLITQLGVTPLVLALCVSTLFMMTGSGRFIPAMTLLSLVIDPKKRGTFMGLENAFRQLASGAASLIAGLIIYEGAGGRLERFGIIGLASVAFTLVAWFFARKISRDAGVS